MAWAEAAKSLGTILLAAGSSSRLGQPKQLLSINEQPLVVRQAQLLLALNPVCTVVVTGAVDDLVRQALTGMTVQFVHNSEWAKGMGRSLACGVAVMPERVRGVLLMLCDQWRIESSDLQQLVQTWSENPQSAVVAHANEISGPPVIFPRRMFARLSRLKGEQGARQVLRAEPGEVKQVVMPHAAFDIDVPADIPV